MLVTLRDQGINRSKICKTFQVVHTLSDTQERFAIACCKLKLRAITRANQIMRKHHMAPMRTQSDKAWENTSEHVVIGLALHLIG